MLDRKYIDPYITHVTDSSDHLQVKNIGVTHIPISHHTSHT